MNGHRRSPRLMQLVQLLAISSTAAAVSLQDFQTVTIFQVPSLSCLGAYGNPIPGCTRDDFQRQTQCSDHCARGIRHEQRNLFRACKNIEVNDRSLLGLALQGGLVDALCPGFQTPPVTSTTEPTTTQTFLTPIPTQEPSTSTTFTTFTTSTPETSSVMSTSSDESSTTIQSTPNETDTTVAIPTSTEASTTAIDLPPATSAPGPMPTAVNPDDQDDQGGKNNGPSRGSTGGGSPFDPVPGSAESILRRDIGGLAILTASLITALIIG